MFSESAPAVAGRLAPAGAAAGFFAQAGAVAAPGVPGAAATTAGAEVGGAGGVAWRVAGAGRREGGAVAQALSKASNAASKAGDNHGMWLILLEALGAMLLLILIVWWTMFSGRQRGERSSDDEPRR